MRLPLRAAGFLALVLVAIRCTDAPTGLRKGEATHGVIAMAPAFSASAASIYKSLAQFGSAGTVTEVHVTLTAPDGTARDTVISFPADQDSLVINIPVPLSTSGETFTALLELRNDQHTVLFSGTQTVVARPSESPALSTPVITVQYTGPGHGTKTVTVSPPDTSVSTGTSLPYVATAVDSSGHVVSDLLVNWASSDATIATVAATGNASATITWTGKRGVTTISATTPSSIVGSSKLTVVPPPSKIVVVSGANQTGAAGAVLAQPLIVEVDAVDNAPVAGVTVNFSAVTAGGAVKTTSAVTDATGRVSTNLTLGQTVGAYQYQASSGTLAAVTASETATAGAAASIAKSAGDGQSATVGTAVAVAPKVLVKDAFGNVVPNASVTFAVASGGGSVTAAAATTDASGLAAVGSWTLGNAAGANTLTATTGTFSTTFSATGSAGVATKLAFVQAPPATITVGAVNAAVTARLVDAFNNPVALAGVVVTLRAIAAPSADSIVATATTDATGLVTYSTPIYLGAIGTATVTLSAPTYTSVVSSTIQLVAGAAAQLVVKTQPSTTVASGAALAVQPVIQVTDAGPNAVSTQGINVVASLVGGGTLSGTTTVATDASGKATFTDLVVTGVVGTRSLTFAKAGLISATSNSFALMAGVAASITKNAGDAQTATAGSAVSVAPKVQMKDVSGNPVPNASVVFAVASGGGSATGTAATTDASGFASVGSWTLGNTAGANTLSATSGTLVATFTATGTAGVGSKFAFVQLPASFVVGSGSLISAQLVDASGNSVAQAGVVVTLVGTLQPANVSTPPTTATTDATGLATFILNKYTYPVGDITATVSATGYTSLSSAPIPALVGPAAAIVITTQPGATASNGVAFTTQPLIQIVDLGENPVSVAGVNVTASILTGSGTLGGKTTVQTDAAGKAFFADLSISGTTGLRTLSFSALNGTTSLGSVTSNGIQVGAGAATTIGIIGATSGLTATVSTAVAMAPQAKVTDANGNGVAGVVVTFNVATGTGGSTISNGTITAASNVTVTTNASGIAQLTTWTLGAIAQQYQVTASAAGLINSPGLFLANAVAAGGSQLAFATSPAASGTSGSPLSPQPAIQLKDASGNSVTTSGVVITAAIATGTGSLTNVTATTGIDGKATFSGLTITGASGNFTLAFGASGYVTITSGTIAIGAATPTKLVITTQPSSTVTSGVVFPNQPVIQVVDANNNPVAGVFAISVTVGGGTGTLGGTSGTLNTNASGQAAFSGVYTTFAVGTRTLVFSSGTLTGVTSTPMTVNAGPASLIFKTTGDQQTAVAGTTLPIALSVTVTDAGFVPIAGVPVVFTPSPGNGSVTGGSTTTDVNGVATLGSWTLRTIAGSNFLTATAAGSFSTTFSEAGSTGVAAKLVLAAPLLPATATSGVVFSTQPSVQVTDANGNNVNGVFPITVTQGSGPGALGGTTTVNTVGATGRATFTDLFPRAGVGPRTLLFQSGELATVTSNTITVSSSAAAALVVNGGNGQSANAGTTVAVAPSVVVLDAGGAPLPGVAVAFTASGSGSVTGSPATSDAGGIATVGSWKLSNAAGSNTLTATATGGITATFSATGTVGTATKIVITSAIPSSITVGAPQPAISVQLQDAAGNLTTLDSTLSVDGLVNPGSTPLHLGSFRTSGGQLTVNPPAYTGPTGTVVFTVTGLNLTSAITPPITIVAGAPAAIKVITQPPSTAQNGVVFTPSPVVQLVDAGGNAVTGPAATIDVAVNPVGNLTGATHITTDVNGQALFADLAINGTLGTTHLSFTGATQAGSLTPTTSNSISMTPGTTTTLAAVSTTSQSVNTGASAIAPSVKVTDQFNNPVAGVVVAFTANGPGANISYGPSSGTNLNVTTDATGVATLSSWTVGGNAGTYTVSATATVSNGSPVVFTANATSLGRVLTVTSGARAVTVRGNTSPTVPIVVRLTNGGSPVANASIDVSYSFGGVCSSVATEGGRTNSDGYYTIGVTLADTTGRCDFTASSGIGASATAQLAVVPTNATHAWFGGDEANATSIDVDNNWIRVSDGGAHAPAATTDVPYIAQLEETGYLARMQADRTFGGIIVGDGSTIDLAGHTLTTTGDIVAPAGTFQGGPVIATGHNVNVNAYIDQQLTLGAAGSCGPTGDLANLGFVYVGQLVVTCKAVVTIGAFSNGKLVALPGSVIAVNYGAALTATDSARFAGDSLTLADNSEVGSNGLTSFGGHLTAGNGTFIFSSGDAVFQGDGVLANGQIQVSGNVSFGGVGSGGYSFTGGELDINGNFSQINGGTAPAFHATGDHTTNLFSLENPRGTTISFADPVNSKFGSLGMYNSEGVSFLTDMRQEVDGEVSPFFAINAGTVSVPAGVHLYLNGLLDSGDGTSFVVDGVVTGAVCDLTYGNFSGLGTLNGGLPSDWPSNCGLGGGPPAGNRVSASRIKAAPRARRALPTAPKLPVRKRLRTTAVPVPHPVVTPVKTPVKF